MARAIFLGLRNGERRSVGFPRGWLKLERGNQLFAYDPWLDCPHCDGCGCKSCKFTGFKKGREPNWDEIAGEPAR